MGMAENNEYCILSLKNWSLTFIGQKYLKLDHLDKDKLMTRNYFPRALVVVLGTRTNA